MMFFYFSVCVYGGGNRQEQVKVVTQGVDIVIATPGRLNDLVIGGKVFLFFIFYMKYKPTYLLTL